MKHEIDPFDVPASPADLLRIQALFASVKPAPQPQGKAPMSASDKEVYVERAVHEGRFGTNIVCRLMKDIMGADMAQRFADELMQAFFDEHAPRTAAERALVEHIAILHAQTLLCRARWAGTTHLADLEAVTRIESRLTREFERLLDVLAAQRDGRRVTIANANIAAGTQVIHQEFHANELGADHG